jgi:S1-C subfamily serine protease
MSSFDLAAFSDAVAGIAEKAAPLTASFKTQHGRTATAFHWGDGFYVAAEEVVEPDEEQQLTLASGEAVSAELVGRDPSTGIALLKPGTDVASLALEKADLVRPGHLIVAAGRDDASPLAVLGTVGEVGPAWRSMTAGAASVLPPRWPNWTTSPW